MEKEKRTIFIGNVPLTAKEKDIRAVFQKYGKIESVRFRSIPFSIGGDRKVNFKRKMFHPERKSCNCYVVFSLEESARNSLVENGKLLLGNTLRLDSVVQPAVTIFKQLVSLIFQTSGKFRKKKRVLCLWEISPSVCFPSFSVMRLNFF